jgi:hypothetical protein
MKNKTQHTPGPWKVVKNEDFIRVDVPTDGITCGTIFESCRGEGEEQNLADAHLIASAPELKAALLALLEMVTDSRTHGPEVLRAANALAKSEGKPAVNEKNRD